ncbi:MAG TPA: hypothetical protein VIL40_01300 [Thermaerobacter sp.]
MPHRRRARAGGRPPARAPWGAGSKVPTVFQVYTRSLLAAHAAGQVGIPPLRPNWGRERRLRGAGRGSQAGVLRLLEAGGW